MLRTIEYGEIRIVGAVDRRFDVSLGFDLIGEWEFFQLPDGEIVALETLD